MAPSHRTEHESQGQLLGQLADGTAAEKLESDKKLLAKLQKKIERKLETVTKKETRILPVNEDPVNDVKDDNIKPELTEKIIKVKPEVKEEKVKKVKPLPLKIS